MSIENLKVNGKPHSPAPHGQSSALTQLLQTLSPTTLVIRSLRITFTSVSSVSAPHILSCAMVPVTDNPAERNGRKTLTTVQGLSKEYSPKALLKAFKKEYGLFHRLPHRHTSKTNPPRHSLQWNRHYRPGHGRSHPATGRPPYQGHGLPYRQGQVQDG
jgi:hypothetical protein